MMSFVTACVTGGRMTNLHMWAVVTRDRYRFKADKPQETTEEVEFKKQQAMQEDMKQMTRRVGAGGWC